VQVNGELLVLIQTANTSANNMVIQSQNHSKRLQKTIESLGGQQRRLELMLEATAIKQAEQKGYLY